MPSIATRRRVAAADEYLSGDVVAKLEEARVAAAERSCLRAQRRSALQGAAEAADRHRYDGGPGCAVGQPEYINAFARRGH
jgi:hypothetical protein